MTHDTSNAVRWAGAMKLLGAVVAIAFLWLSVLPSVARRSAMRDYLEWLDAQRINPDAMYYTELKLLDAWQPREDHACDGMTPAAQSRDARP